MNELALFNDLFDGFGEDRFVLPSFNYRKAFTTPKVDVKETKDLYTLEMDLPGKTDKDISIEIDRNILTISSENKTEKNEKPEEAGKKDDGEKYIIRERTYSHFSRSFTVPEDVEKEGISAEVVNGVLKVNMPRKILAEPRRIEVKAC